MRTTLRYCEVLDLNPTSRTCVAWTFGINDLFDPRSTVGGAQPRGFEQYTLIYDHYTALSSKVKVSWMYEGYSGPSLDNGTAGALTQNMNGKDQEVPAVSPAIVGIFKSGDTFDAATTIVQQLEKDRTVSTVINPQSPSRSSSSRSDLSEFFGKQDLVAAEGFGGLTGGTGVGSSPENKAYYHVFAARGSDDYPNGSCKLTAAITIEYDVVFTDPKALPDSG